jgi:hypothetical protein
MFTGASVGGTVVTTTVGADEAEPEPALFVALTRTRIVFPTSALTSR